MAIALFRFLRRGLIFLQDFIWRFAGLRIKLVGRLILVQVKSVSDFLLALEERGQFVHVLKRLPHLFLHASEALLR